MPLNGRSHKSVSQRSEQNISFIQKVLRFADLARNLTWSCCLSADSSKGRTKIKRLFRLVETLVVSGKALLPLRLAGLAERSHTSPVVFARLVA